MKKSTRISLLVFTICAAILAFGALWYTMPGTPSYVIEEAKQRQNVPLLEVSEPATRLPPPEINYDLLAGKIEPKIKESLLNDDAFISSIVVANKAEIQKAVQQYTDNQLVPNLEDKISQLVMDLSKSLSNSLKSDLSIMVDEKVSNEIQNEINSIDLNSYLPQLVDSLTPIVVEQIYNEIELNKEDFVQTVKADVNEKNLTEEDIKQLYIEYRTQIINDLVPVILDNIETYIKENLDVDISKLDINKIINEVENQENPISVLSTKEEPKVKDTVKKDVVTEDVVTEDVVTEDVVSEDIVTEDVVTEDVVTEEVVTEEVVSEEVVTEDVVSEDVVTEEVVTEEVVTEEVVAEKPSSISATIVAQVPKVSKAIEEEYTTKEGESISIPSFTSSQPQVLNSEDYESLRDQIRQQAINDALAIISEE